MRTTITINDKLYLQLRRRALDAGVTVSSYLEDAAKNQLLEDSEDIEDAEKRKNEPTYSFDDLVAEFKAEGLL